MKIARFNGGRVGVVRGDEIVDVTELCGVNPGAWPPVGMNALIANFDSLGSKLEAARSPALKLASVRLDTPVPWPNKVIAYPANYQDHAAEMGATIRANSQGWFLKPSSSVSGPNDPVELPALPWRRIDHEAELGIIIGKVGRNIDKNNWRDYIFGYTCLLDMVVRGKEERVMRKGYDTFFFYGADNHFDNQDVFYQKHGMRHVEDENDMAPCLVLAAAAKSLADLNGLSLCTQKTSGSALSSCV